MESRPRTTVRPDDNRKSSTAKFKQVKQEYNQLQSKYDIYKNGSPNVYEQNIDNLKVYHIKHDIKTLSLPAIDYLLQEIKNIPETMGTNHRNFVTHPTMLQKYGNKFRNLISDQQEIKDFLDWFRKKQSEISHRNCKASQKFNLNQNLIASGFNQILIQIGSISKSRAQLLRMLWNKQNTEVEQVINFMHKQNSEFEKKNLQAVKSLHLGYQQQIISLRNDNYWACNKLEQAAVLNEGCINSLRTMRKQIKKYEKIIKQLNQANYQLKMESIQVLQENINLIMKEKNISFDKARILSYQALQLGKMRKDLQKNKKVKNLFTDVKNKAEFLIDNNEVPDFENKKQKLVKFITNRMKQNPSQKACIMKGQLSDEDDEQIKLEQTIEQILNCKELRAQLQEKAPKKNNFFQTKSTMTEISQMSETQHKKSFESVGIQTATLGHEHSKPSLLNGPQIEQVEGMIILQKKKTQKRHSLLLLEMDKMMEFKKLDRGSRPMRITPIINATEVNSKTSRFNSEAEETSNRQESPLQSESDKDQSQDYKKEESQNGEMKKRQINIRRRHNQSLLIGKSSEFQQLLQKFVHQNSKQPEQQKQILKQPKVQKISTAKSIPKIDLIAQKANDIKELVVKYMQKKSQQKQTAANPQKQLKKILTDTFKNIFISKKTNFLNQMLRTAKNSYGKIIYENKLIHLISLVIDNKQKCLLGALTILLGIPNTTLNYDKVNYEDVNDLYFKAYFCLCSKTPIQNQFNIWGNYTTLQKMNSPSFTSILQNYFSESKCMYLKLKIREFIGVGAIEEIENNYYVQINPLMLYILQVYLLEKQNYYESYSPIVNFLTEDPNLDLETFVFLLDLLCFKEEQQKQLINTYFRSKTEDETLYCDKDLFYRICVKYQLPLFEFIKILKLEQFKKLHQCLQSEYNDISDFDKWSRTRENIQKMLMMKGAYTGNMRKIINKLNNYVKSSPTVLSQPFLFLFRIVIHTAFSC